MKIPYKIFLPILALLLLSCSGGGAGRSSGAGSGSGKNAPGYDPKTKTYKMKARKIGPDIYAVLSPARDLPNPKNGGWNSNSAFVITKDGVLLFDSGSSQKIGATLKQTIATVTDKPVRWIVNSHAHGDHWLGNAAFKKTVKDIYASEQVAESIFADGQTWIDRFRRMTKGAIGKSEIMAPEKTITKRTEVVLGGRKFVLFPSGNSHSRGDILLWMPEERALFTGDVVYSTRMPSTFASNLDRWIVMLGELERLKPRVVVPGHGDLTDATSITRMREMFTILWRETRKHQKNGLSPEKTLPLVRQAVLKFKPHYPGFEDKLKRDMARVHAQAEIANKRK